MAIIRKIVSRIFERINRYIHPSHLAVFSRDLFKIHNQIHTDKDHLRTAMEWLCKSQDITGCGGSSAGYSFDRGWLPPYPETTGYIIPTFLHYASLSGNSGYLERAKMMGDWEIEIQLPSGGIRGGVGINEYPIVFNTGQVILGWTALYKHLKLNRFMDAAIKAADWLLTVQDHDGSWSKHTYNGIPRAYHSRVAWPLFEVYRHTNDEKYKNAAEKNILWVLSLAKGNGWFSQIGFTEEEPAFTHTIAYTLRGLIEASVFLEEVIKQEIVDKVYKASENIMIIYELRKKNPYSMPSYLPGTLSEKWESNDNYSCLTGNAQIAIIWVKIYGITNDARFLNAALKIIDQIKATQNLDNKNTGIRGGIAGSYPIWGKYQRFIYPNWATKFFADSIMLQESIMKKLEGTQI